MSITARLHPAPDLDADVRDPQRRTFPPTVAESAASPFARRSASPDHSVFILATPGNMPISPPMPPIFIMPSSWSRRSFRSNWPLRMRSAVRIAFSASIVCAAFSTSETMSPMPRIRPAMRSGCAVDKRVQKS